jgi:nucleoid DNA-binding protein
MLIRMSSLSKNVSRSAGGKSGGRASGRKHNAGATVTLKHLAGRAMKSSPKVEAEKVTNDLVGLISKHLKKGDRIRIGGLGVLMVRQRAGRMGLQPIMSRMIEPEAKSADVAYAPSARALALLRGKRIAEEDLKANEGAFSLQEVVNFLSVSRQAIDRKVRENALIAVPGPHGRRRYPVVQFDKHGIVPGLEDVLNSLPSKNDWFRLNFLVNEDVRLGGRRPIDVLKAGDVEEVIKAAEAVGIQGK